MASSSSSKRWASIISSFATLVFFSIIIFQLPLFRVPCRIGICKSPIELTSSQLLATELFPVFAVKPLLYPGTVAKSYFKNKSIPSYGKFLKLYDFTKSSKILTGTELMHLEILAGSYLTVVGALLGLLRAGRMSLFGTLLIIWGFFRRRSDNSYHIHTATIFIAAVCAFLTIRKDVRTLIRCFRGRRDGKSVQLKVKYK